MSAVQIIARLWLLFVAGLVALTVANWTGDPTDYLTLVWTAPLSIFAVWITR